MVKQNPINKGISHYLISFFLTNFYISIKIKTSMNQIVLLFCFETWNNFFLLALIIPPVVIVAIRCHSLYHLWSLVVPLVVSRCITRCHSLSLVVTRCIIHLSFPKRSLKLWNYIRLRSTHSVIQILSIKSKGRSKTEF